MPNRFDLYGALYVFCARFHSGQNSRGYRILSRLTEGHYQPSLSLEQGRFESDEQRQIYRSLVKAYRGKV